MRLIKDADKQTLQMVAQALHTMKYQGERLPEPVRVLLDVSTGRLESVLRNMKELEQCPKNYQSPTT